MPDSPEARWRIDAVVQARTGSSRLPGKVLREIDGRPMLQLLLERLWLCRSIDRVAVVTSAEPADDPIQRFCEHLEVPCLRGPLADVAARYRAALDVFGLDAFVRVTGDSPLLDPALVDRAVALFREGGADVVTNVWPRSFPRGQSVEVVDAGAFRRAYAAMHRPEQREHVTRLFYETPDQWRIRNFAAPDPHADVQLSVDTPDDFALLEAIVARMDQPQWTYGLTEVLELRAAVVAPPVAR